MAPCVLVTRCKISCTITKQHPYAQSLMRICIIWLFIYSPLSYSTFQFPLRSLARYLMCVL